MDLFKLLGTISIDDANAKKSLQDVSNEGKKAESKLGKACKAIGNGAIAAGKAIGVGMAAGAVAVGGLVAKSVQSYGQYEQLVGGVETLFKDSAQKVQDYAAKAFATAGLSANAYMETVTSFSASLLQSLGGDTAKAADMADMAIRDMSDNANKMGTDMTMIQNAYQGFAKQNYTMLDNLKLGYGGTKEEMSRLLADAEKISGIKYDISSYADVVSAIHVIQEEMGIAGTTAAEAAGTITGSLASVKASWQNLLTAMSADDLPFDTYVNNFVESAATAAENLMPRIEIALGGVVKLIDALAPVIIEKVPDLFNTLLPAIVNGATSIVRALTNALPGMLGAVTNVLPTLIDSILTVFNTLIEMIPDILTQVIASINGLIPQLVRSLVGIVVTLVNEIPRILGVLVTYVPQAIQLLVEALLENLPILLAGIVTMIGELINQLPTIIDVLLAMVVNLMTMVLEQLPIILPMLLDAVIQLITMLIEQIPVILPLIVSACLMIIQLLQEQLPVLLPMLVDAVISIVYLLIDQLPVIIPMLIEACITVTMAIVQALPAILKALTDALPRVLKAVWDAIVMVFKNLPQWFGQLFSGAVDIIKGLWSALVGFFKGIWGAICQVFSPVKDWFKGIFQGAWDGIKNAWSGVKDFFSNIGKGIADAFSNIKEKLSKPFTDARDKIQEVAEKIKGFFKGEISMPKIKVPKFSIKPSGWEIGDLLDGVIPKLGITWHAKGGIMKEPTLFGYNPATGTVHGGGEAGDEAIAPISTLQQYVKAAVASENTVIVTRLDRIIALLVQFFPDVLEALDFDMYLDGDNLVGGIARKMDNALGKIAIQKGRGR